MLSRHRIPVVFPQRRSALAAFRAAGSRLSLLVPLELPSPREELVNLSVGFGDCPERFELTGVVRRRHEAQGAGREPDLGVEFEGPARLPLAEMIAFCAGRPLEADDPGKSRFQVQIPCRIRSGEQDLDGEVADISATGLFAAARLPATVGPGSGLRLQLEPQWLGLLGQWVSVQVVWLGQKLGRPGFGASFCGPGSSYLPAIRKYLAAE